MFLKLTFKTTPDGSGMVLEGRAHDVRRLTWLVQNVCARPPYGKLLVEFLVSLMYDLHQGLRADTAIGRSDGRVSVRHEWPVFLLQLWLLLLARAERPGPILLDLLSRTVEALLEWDPDAGPEVLKRMTEWTAPPDEFLGLYAWGLARHFRAVPAGERPARLPEMITSLSSDSRKFRAFKTALLLEAHCVGCAPEDLVGCEAL